MLKIRVDGQVVELPTLKGSDGISVSNAEIVDGNLILTYSDGTSSNLGSIVGEKGADGQDGKNGINGINGKDGISCTHSFDGTVLTVTSASGTSSVDLKGDKGDTGTNGKDGIDGYTPVKGIDYYTENEKSEIIAQVLEAINGSSVFGYVDENNNIVVSGNLDNGTYTVKYELEDGTTLNIGNLVLDADTYYLVTSNLTNCTNSNHTTEVVEGDSYTATITPNSGYNISSIAVTMGGIDVTTSTVNDGNINITNVTGNIVITVIAEEVVNTPSYENLLPSAVDANGNDFVGENGEDGYKYGYRISRSGGGETATDGVYCTGFMEADHSAYIRIKGITEPSNTSYGNMVYYDAEKKYLGGVILSASNTSIVSVDENGVYVTRPWAISGTDNTAFFRFSAGSITDETIVTVNQEIV